MNLNEKKILFADLDGTLITTASGKTFAEDCTDFRIRKDVLDKIKTIKGTLICVNIVTNQGGIPQYVSKEDFETKLTAIRYFVAGYTDVSCYSYYCASLNKDDCRRKPNTGMLKEAWNEWLSSYGKEDALMIGDASGKPGQFSDSDKKCAENFGIDYLDVEDFLAISC